MASDLEYSAPPGRSRPSEPRREIWFTRRVSLAASVRELWGSRELVRTLAERDLRARYKQAALGAAWAVVTPFVLTVAFTLLFRRAVRVETHGVPYPLFAYLGLVTWTFFSSTVSMGGLSLVSNTSLLNKIYCPREVFPLASMIVAAVDTTLSMFGLVFLFVVTGFLPKATTLWVPVLLVVQVAYTLGCTLVISSALVYLRDLKHALALMLQFGLFVTPVAYGLDQVPRSARYLYAAADPLAPVIDGYRRAVLYGKAPDWPIFLTGAAGAVVILLGGYYMFKKLETGIADVA